ncbi:MAG: hypothetical protein WBC44_02940 [Planctomycetaceae bacterium]
MPANLTATERRVTREAAQALVGRTIRRVFYLPARTADDLYWDHRPLVLEFDDGTTLYAACDEEGNDAGAMFVDRGPHFLCLGRLPVEGR